jgi:hypothetical protein
MGEKARLCEIVQGVQFTVIEAEENIRAIILRDALEEFFGADAEPESWLLAYRKHQDIIDSAASDRFRRERSSTLTVLRADRPDDFQFVASARRA